MCCHTMSAHPTSPDLAHARIFTPFVGVEYVGMVAGKTAEEVGLGVPLSHFMTL